MDFNRWASLFFIVVLLIPFSSTGQDIEAVKTDEKLGKEASRAVEAEMGIYDHPVLKKYVEEVGNRLLSQFSTQPFKFRFNLVDSGDPNAFALPGGYVYVTRGLLLLVNTEDELAGVLGHEMIHVLERHSAKQMKKSILPGLLALPGAVLGQVVSEDLGQLINSPVENLGNAYISTYSRSQETQADQLGIDLAARAGYNPADLAVILQQLEKEVEFITGKSSKFSFQDDHPLTTKRINNINKISPELKMGKKNPVAGDKSELYGFMNGMYIGDNPVQGVFTGRRFWHPVMNFTIEFPEGWKTINSSQYVGAYTEAQDAFLFVGVEEGNPDPVLAAEKYRETMKEKNGNVPMEGKPLEINGGKAYLLTMTESTRDSVMNIYFLWVALNKVTFKMIGFGGDANKRALRESAFSFREIQENEKEQITFVQLETVMATEGETLENLGIRSGNVLGTQGTAIINNLPENIVLKEGQPLKVGIRKKYDF